MNKIMLVFLITLMPTAQAEVFKCVLKDKTVYHLSPVRLRPLDESKSILKNLIRAKIAKKKRIKALERRFRQAGSRGIGS